VPPTPQGWSRVEPVLDGALDLDPAARGSYLDHACGADAGLRAEVEALLRSCDAARDVHFLEGSAHAFLQSFPEIGGRLGCGPPARGAS
jgi:hypothetical protein